MVMVSKLNKYVEVLERICRHIQPGKKAVQKLAYLIERSGVDLDLEYRIHFFGPYSAKLDNVLHLLQCNEVIEINTQKPTHIISIIDIPCYEGEKLTDEEKEIVDSVLDNFSGLSALELEGITTIDYVATSIECTEVSSDDAIIEKVKHIKGTKFSDGQLKRYLEILKQYNFLS